MTPVAEVIVDLPAAGVDRPLDYLIPEHLVNVLQPGHRVIVPLQGRRVEGFVIGRKEDSEHPSLREISALVDERPVFGPAEVELAHWLSERFLFLRVEALRCFLPPHSRLGLKRRTAGEATPVAYRLAPSARENWEALVEEKKRRAPAQARLLHVLAQGAPVPRKLLLAEVGASGSALRSLVEQGLVERVTGDQGGEGERPAGQRAPGEERPVLPPLPPLTPEQAQAVKLIGDAVRRGAGARPILLRGVTGSGKTEVYMRAAAEVLEQGGQALILVPEIALTPQVVARFRARFGSRVALWHSRLAAGERVREWWRVYRGEAPLVVGTRSAVFAPLQRIRLIVIDEEHEPSYKQDEAPRYHARDVAEERARRAGAVLVLGSATPSLETYWRVVRGEMEFAELSRRVNGRPLPEMELVDMRDELRRGNRGILSRHLQEALTETVRKGGQAMLFINRRGYSNFVLCRECGLAIGCPDCSVSLTYHADRHALRCHYCDRSQPVPARCPGCGSTLLRRFGAGTQRVEEAVRAVLPGARILRLDVDTTRRKGELERILEAFGRGEAQVLVGTQMIAKGHDFPGVSLMGAVAADSGLHLPDFRSAERTFQLLTQAAGRAGRADAPGRVIVQTYNPDHYSIQAACAYDYGQFFEREIGFRRLGGYPPVKALARVLFTGPDPRAVREAALRGRKGAAAALHGLSLDVLGPAPAPLAKLQNRYRWHTLIKGARAEEVREAAAAIRAAALRGRFPGVTVSVDIDPVSVM